MISRQFFSNIYTKSKTKIKDLIQNKTFLTCAFLLVLFLLSGYCRWIEILVCASALISMVFLSINSGLCVLAFLHCFNLSNITYYSCLPITMVGFTIILLVKYILGVKKKKYDVHKTILILMAILYGAWTIFSLWNLIYYSGFYYYAYLPLAYLLFVMRKDIKISKVMNFLCAGVLVSSVFAIIFQFMPGFQYDVIAGGRFRAFMNNTNNLYIRALFVLSYYMYRFINNKLKALPFIALYLLLSVISLATISKTSIIMLAFISLLFVIFYLRKDFKKKIKYVLALLGVLIIVAFICKDFILDILSRFSSAFKSKNILVDLFTFRTIIWETYLKECFKNPFYALFGHGILTKRIESLAVYGPPETHNLYIFLLHRLGIIGTLLLIYIIYRFIKASKCKKPKGCAYLPLIFLFVEGLVENVFNAYNFIMFIFATMILFMECEQPENENNKELQENNTQDNITENEQEEKSTTS